MLNKRLDEETVPTGGMQTIDLLDSFNYVWFERKDERELQEYFRALVEQDYIVDWASCDDDIAFNRVFYKRNRKYIMVNYTVVGNNIIQKAP